MASDRFQGGISRTGVFGNYSCELKDSKWGQKPVNIQLSGMRFDLLIACPLVAPKMEFTH